MLEAELLRYAKAKLERSGLLWWRVANGPSIYKEGSKIRFRPSPIAGFPDLAGLTATGRFWAIELKTEKGKLQANQSEWIVRIRASGGIATVVRSFEEFDATVARIKKADAPNEESTDQS
jgi:hypothetical protein